MTAGMATSRPTAVAISASAMPAMTALDASAMLAARSRNERTMPSTVPNSPM